MFRRVFSEKSISLLCQERWHLVNTKLFVSETIEIKTATKVESYDRISSLAILNVKKQHERGMINIKMSNLKHFISWHPL